MFLCASCGRESGQEEAIYLFPDCEHCREEDMPSKSRAQKAAEAKMAVEARLEAFAAGYSVGWDTNSTDSLAKQRGEDGPSAINPEKLRKALISYATNISSDDMDLMGFVDVMDTIDSIVESYSNMSAGGA